jgi:uracil-DNA glycosylase
MDAAVRRDIHKMHAFVRFKEIEGIDGEPSYFAWFEPQHLILRRAASFFVKRFGNMRWTIATPDGAAVWDRAELRWVTSPAEADRPPSDPCDALWRTYYRSICNPARINPAAMQREMPRLYWRNLPEAREIGALVRDGISRVPPRQQQRRAPGGALPKAVQRSLAELAEAPTLQSCRRCELWRHATQAVAGTGPADARLMLVGEQPGDEEDLAGKPFVGPAGRLLDAALAAAGIPRESIYITNAVKHFKWQPRGKRRLHKRPDVREIEACHGWLAQEIERIRPRVVMALGATALRALTGSALAIETARQEPRALAGGAELRVTYHPSAVLRADEPRAQRLRAALIEDLRQAHSSVADTAARRAVPVT